MTEQIIASNIMSHLEKNNILCPEQHGFRCRRSCETQLLGYVDETSEELERGNQEDTIVLDYEKAFDKVSHTPHTSCVAVESEVDSMHGLTAFSRTDNWL